MRLAIRHLQTATLEKPPQKRCIVTRTSGAPLTTAELPLLFTRVWRALDDRRDQIDALNVFPVPDADTGTNMVHTIKAGLDALRDARRRQIRDHTALAQTVIRGVIRGARGNSGVILSQVLRAVVEETTRHDTVDASAYANALQSAHNLAYGAVVTPVSGTMLSVIAAAAHAAETAVKNGATLSDVSRQACAATREAVEHTPEQLAVLKDAGVVDAGGRGFEVLITAVHAFLTGEQLDVAVDVGADLAYTGTSGCHASELYPYEVQYLLETDNAQVAPLRDALTPHGDSLVVVAAGDLVNVHIHTANVGAVIDVGVGFAPPQNVTITDLRQQIDDVHAAHAHPVLFVAVTAHPHLAGLIGQAPGVILTSLNTPVAPAAIGSAPALLITGADTPAGATAARTLAQQHAATGRSDMLAACDSPLAVLAAVSVFHADGAPEQVLASMQTVLNDLTVATVVTDGDQFRLTDPLGHALTTPDFAELVARWLTDVTSEGQLVTVMFGDASTLQQRSDAARIINQTAPDAEQVMLDLPGADVVCWIGVE